MPGPGLQVGTGYIIVQPQLARSFSTTLSRQVQGAGRNAGRQGAAGVDSGLRAAGRGSESHFRTLGRTLGRSLNTGFHGVVDAGFGLAKIAGRASVALGAVAVAGGVAGVKTAAGMEQAQIAFTSMLGSADKAQDLLGNLRTFAEKTPFEFPDLVQSSQRLLAFGFQAKDLIPTLTAVGDAASGLGGGPELIGQITTAIGQIKAKGKVQSDELLQLTEAGIPALQILASSAGVTTGEMQDMVTKGLVPADKAIPILVKGLEQGTDKTAAFGGMMAAQSKTLTGVFSTAKDTLNTLLGQAVAPFIPVITKGVTAITNRLSAATPAIVAFTQRVADALPRVKDGIVGIYNLVVKGDFTAAFSRAFNVGEDSPSVARILGIRDKIVGAFATIREKVSGAFTAIGRSASDHGGGIVGFGKGLLDVGRNALPIVVVGVRALGKILGFLNDHIDTIAKIALPLLITWLIAHKTAQTASRVSIALTIPLQIAQLVVYRQLAVANRALAFQLSILTGQQQRGAIATALHTVRMIAQRVAMAAIWTATRAWAAAQWLLNAAMSANPFVLIATLIVALGVALYEAYKHSETFRNIVQAVFKAVATAGLWMWENVLKPVFGFLVAGWHFIAAAFQLYWDYYMHPIINAFAATVTWLWHTVVEPAFAGIGKVWSGLMAGMAAVYNKVLKPIWGFFEAGVNGIASAVGFVVSAVETVWGKLGSILAWPVNNVLAPIIRNLAGAIDAVLGFLGIQRYLQSWENWSGVSTGGGGGGSGGTGDANAVQVGHHAAGTYFSGYGGGDRHPSLLEDGEVVVRKEGAATVPGGAKALHQAFNVSGEGLSAFGGLYGKGAAGPNYGGVLGDIGHALTHNPVTNAVGGAIKSVAGGVFDAGKWVLDKAEGWLRKGAAAAFDAAYKVFSVPLFSLLPSSGWGQLVRGVPDSIEKKVSDWIKGKEHEETGHERVPYLGGSNTVGLIEQLSDTLGVPSLPVTSTFRPNAGYHGVYEAVDFSNGPGYGPGSQTPGELAFNQAWARKYGASTAELIHAQPGAINIKDGRVVDGIGFYGASTMLDHWNHVHVAMSPASIAAGGSTVGTHDQGGWLPHGATALNMSGRPEAVLNPRQSQQFEQMASGVSGSIPRGPLMHVERMEVRNPSDIDLALARADFKDRLANV